MTDPASDVWAVWERFPVFEVPRPVILLDSVVRFGVGGFVDDDAKSAWMAGAVESSVPVPESVLGRVVADSHDQGPLQTVLTITAVEQGQAEFWCDRGPRLLPAYWLSITGVKERVAVLDPAHPPWWPDQDKDAERRLGRVAFIGSDDTTLRIPATGNWLTEFVRAEFVEHDSYVIGRAVTRQKPYSGHIRAVLVRKHVNGRLAAPLGGRVLLDEDGRPLAVQPEPTAATWTPD